MEFFFIVAPLRNGTKQKVFKYGTPEPREAFRVQGFRVQGIGFVGLFRFQATR